ncbi:MAG TPA: hypothetical protein PKZ69_01330 [Candidatus Cloacimonadota bacterium]|nr:hypothetical protein [Candidatus Cloacimonadota bacterium]HPK40238.1 hypothetical protein [Candidatus Cloacimonadota bacterium]
MQTIDSKLGERIAKIETSIKHMKEQINKLVRIQEEYVAQRLECKEGFVKMDDPTYFNKNMVEYNKCERSKLKDWIKIITLTLNILGILGIGFTISIITGVVK